MSNSEPNATPKQATPPEELERRIMNPNIPKNEQEHWAANEIHRLRDLLTGGCSMHPVATPDQLPIDDQLIALVRVARVAGYDDAAEWISRRAMAQAKKVAEVDEPANLHTAAFHHSMDARVWTAEWLKCAEANPSIAADEGTMLGWFANAIMAGFDEAQRRHEKSNPPASEPSRTDAVREAIRLEALHQNCGVYCGLMSRATAAEWTGDEVSQCVRDCNATKYTRPLLAVLADAERKLADERAESSRAWGQCNSLHAQIAMMGGRMDVTEQRLADAEKRAKDTATALEHVRQQASMQAQEARTQRSIVIGILRRLNLPLEDWNAESHVADKCAALTRKLVTAREVADLVLDVLEGGRLSQTIGDEFMYTADVRQSWVKARRDALAAIDAPAGEEAANGLGVSVTPLPPSDQMCGFTYWATVPPGITKPMSRCINAKPCPLHPNAPPSEPASSSAPSTILPATHIAMPDSSFPVSGTGGAEVQRHVGNPSGLAALPLADVSPIQHDAGCCASRGCHQVCSHLCGTKFYVGGVTQAAAQSTLSAPSFTADEARQHAREYEIVVISRTYHDDQVAFAARLEATLRHYADLLERNDALERAAQRLLAILSVYEDQEKRTKAIDDLRSVLAQRARKVE